MWVGGWVGEGFLLLLYTVCAFEPFGRGTDTGVALERRSAFLIEWCLRGETAPGKNRSRSSKALCATGGSSEPRSTRALFWLTISSLSNPIRQRWQSTRTRWMVGLVEEKVKSKEVKYDKGGVRAIGDSIKW